MNEEEEGRIMLGMLSLLMRDFYKMSASAAAVLVMKAWETTGRDMSDFLIGISEDAKHQIERNPEDKEGLELYIRSLELAAEVMRNLGKKNLGRE